MNCIKGPISYPLSGLKKQPPLKNNLYRSPKTAYSFLCSQPVLKTDALLDLIDVWKATETRQL